MIATRAPSMRKRRAVASPIPLDPPVTTTRLPARPRMQVMLTSGYPVSGAPEQPMTAYPTAASTTPADEPIVDGALEPPLAPPGAARRSIRLKRDVISYLEWPVGARCYSCTDCRARL